jgi:hypothetical protein
MAFGILAERTKALHAFRTVDDPRARRRLSGSIWGHCQHRRGLLVAAALLAAAPPRHFAGEAAPCLGFFQFVHNAKIRGKGLLKHLLDALLA